MLEAYSLGFGEPIAMSAEHGEGVVDLFEQLRRPRARGAEEEEEEEASEGPLKLAIVGRPMPASRR
jgi:GTP-binding protein